LARHIRTHAPGLRTLFMSGYLGNTETVQAVADYNLPFLEKPFTLKELARRVRDALDAPPAALPPAD
jgi:DNA-binding NtrC family response regulator